MAKQGFTVRMASHDKDLIGILRLQHENLKDNVPDKSHGFVTLAHNLELLKSMNQEIGQVIAVDDETDQVVGYALSKTISMRDRIPLLRTLVEKLEKSQPAGLDLENCYAMGQICVDQPYRGSGMFQALYDCHRRSFASQYSSVVTAISASNPRSLRAHQKVGFRILATFDDPVDKWHAVIWDWS
mmetsp:Transcript_8576/g.17811  ORF Transcript_8576/g.17811 Transcript_8576/m.17811 type:complete len:185 (+) Transcript_8576:554-1108(+)